MTLDIFYYPDIRFLSLANMECFRFYARLRNSELPIPPLITRLVLPFQVRPSKMAMLFSFFVVPFILPPQPAPAPVPSALSNASSRKQNRNEWTSHTLSTFKSCLKFLK